MRWNSYGGIALAANRLGGPGSSVRAHRLLQPLVDGVALEPRDVRWGDATFDEMCLMYASLVEPYQDAEDLQIDP